MVRLAPLLLCALVAPSHAFAPPLGRSAASFPAGPSVLGAAAGDNAEASATAPTTYPPLSNEEVEQFLARIPVYAVTDTSTGGVVLMSERKELKSWSETGKKKLMRRSTSCKSGKNS